MSKRASSGRVGQAQIKLSPVCYLYNLILGSTLLPGGWEEVGETAPGAPRGVSAEFLPPVLQGLITVLLGS